jgi:hypothetical protein
MSIDSTPFRRTKRLAAAAALAAMTACSADSNAEVPSPDQSVFVEGDFDQVPVFRAATPVQPVSTKDGTTTGSYETDTASAATVIDWYEQNLPPLGWKIVDPVVESNPGTWRGDWLRDGRRLQVVATSLSGDATRTQLSLVLLADTGDIPVGAPVASSSG